jgi:hypothetical protein
VSQYESERGREPSGWAIAGTTFAAVMMLMIGVFQVIAGIAALVENEFFVVQDGYLYNLDATGWGAVHLILGLILIFGAWALFSGQEWARIFAIVLAVLSAIANFFFIPYYPFWSIVVIALNVWVIWALTRPAGTREL